MIPKIIHYCWFGGNEKPEIIQKCIASWKEHCPDWKIMEWNESNYDVAKNPYVKKAYQSEKWAFVSDFVRLDILYELGGYTWIRMLRSYATILLTNTCLTKVY